MARLTPPKVSIVSDDQPQTLSAMNQLTPQEIAEVIAGAKFAHIGVISNDEPYVTPISFVSLGDGIAFDHGVDYLRCGNLELARKVGADAFAPYVCLSDIALSEGLGWGLIRTQTLADGCSHCDFRFKRGGETRITSRTPEVQATLERLAREESERQP